MLDDPVQINLSAKTPAKTAELHISSYNSKTVIDSGKSSVNANTKSTMG